MKAIQINRITFLFILMLGWMTAKGQQQWEVPGDNFSLEGALEIFKKSATPEEFERMLNDPDARVNNLDLNRDGYIDYIRVVDMYEGNVHTFILQAAISEYESQDIAVITLEKLANGRAILQITGDADIYGVETILEPTTEVRTYAGANRSRVVVNVWSWPLVRYVYGPYYSVWVSPWGWSYRPYWWSPWRPIVYYDYYAFWNPFRWHYSVCYTHRIVHAHRIYRPFRTTSVIVHNIHHHRINEYRSRYIDRDGYYTARESRNSSRRAKAVRYNSDGRIRSDINARASTRSSSVRNTYQSRSSARSENGNTVRSTNQSRSSARSESARTIQRSRPDNQRSTGYNNARISTERRNNNTSQQRSVRSSNRQESARVSSGNTNMRTADRNSAYRKSDAGSRKSDNYRRGNTSPKVQQSSGRSRENSNVKRYQQTSRNSSVKSGSSNSSRSRSSYGRTSGNSGSRISSGTSGNRKSSANRSSIQRSSSGSNKTISRSSGKSNNSRRGRDH